jgi:hypothetical protein
VAIVDRFFFIFFCAVIFFDLTLVVVLTTIVAIVDLIVHVPEDNVAPEQVTTVVNNYERDFGMPPSTTPTTTNRGPLCNGVRGTMSLFGCSDVCVLCDRRLSFVVCFALCDAGYCIKSTDSCSGGFISNRCPGAVVCDSRFINDSPAER